MITTSLGRLDLRMPQFPCHGWITPKLQDGKLVCSGALDGPYKRSCSQCSLAVRMCLGIFVLSWPWLPRSPHACLFLSFRLWQFLPLWISITVFNWLGQQAGDLLSCSLDLKMALRRRTWSGMFHCSKTSMFESWISLARKDHLQRCTCSFLWKTWGLDHFTKYKMYEHVHSMTSLALKNA